MTRIMMSLAAEHMITANLSAVMTRLLVMINMLGVTNNFISEFGRYLTDYPLIQEEDGGSNKGCRNHITWIKWRANHKTKTID